MLAASTCYLVRSRRHVTALLVASLFGCGVVPAFAGQGGAAADQSADEQLQSKDPADADYDGLDYTRPQQSAETRLRFQTSSSPTSQTDQEALFLRLTTRVDLLDGWRLRLLGQAPFVDRETTTLAPPNTTRDAGLGDVLVQADLSHAIDSHWAYGFGARLVAPTGGDSLGPGKWLIMPGFGVRYSFLEIGPDTFFVPVVRWAVSFAGDPARRNINQPEIAPTFNLGLPQHWFFVLYPSNDIRINFGDPVPGQTGRLFLPFDAAIGRNFTDRVTALLEFGVPIINAYPVYNFKTELRISVRF